MSRHEWLRAAKAQVGIAIDDTSETYDVQYVDVRRRLLIRDEPTYQLVKTTRCIDREYARGAPSEQIYISRALEM